MITVRKSEDRGIFDHGWLFAKHSFSFGEYQDPKHRQFRSLRVINEDQIQAGEGFPQHPHESMEILTYIIEGQLEHKDSMGNHGVIAPGGVQYMSAGSGVQHSEFNHSQEHRVHLLQIWIFPETKGGAPNYGQKSFSIEERKNTLRMIASPDGAQDSIVIRQNAKLFASLLDSNQTLRYELEAGRGMWVQLAKGELEVNGVTLHAGDGAQVEDESNIQFQAKTDAEFLVFDLL